MILGYSSRRASHISRWRCVDYYFGPCNCKCSQLLIAKFQGPRIGCFSRSILPPHGRSQIRPDGSIYSGASRRRSVSSFSCFANSDASCKWVSGLLSINRFTRCWFLAHACDYNLPSNASIFPGYIITNITKMLKFQYGVPMRCVLFNWRTLLFDIWRWVNLWRHTGRSSCRRRRTSTRTLILGYFCVCLRLWFN